MRRAAFDRCGVFGERERTAGVLRKHEVGSEAGGIHHRTRESDRERAWRSGAVTLARLGSRVLGWRAEK